MRKLIPELLSRITIGSVFIESGWGKLHDLEKVTAFFESLHIPLASLQAPMVSGLELLCGVCILIGCFTRLASLPLMVIMLIALRTAKWDDISDFSSLTEAIEFLYLVILTWLAVEGSHYLSVDRFVFRRKSSP